MSTQLKPKTLTLTKSANRVALLCGIAAGTVTNKELEAVVIQDTAPREYRKPVVAEGQFFLSVSDAARWMYKNNAGNRFFVKGNRTEYQVINSLQQRISRWCTADDVEGYYWAE